jgi:hypothetical protein
MADEGPREFTDPLASHLGAICATAVGALIAINVRQD